MLILSARSLGEKNRLQMWAVLRTGVPGQLCQDNSHNVQHLQEQSECKQTSFGFNVCHPRCVVN